MKKLNNTRDVIQFFKIVCYGIRGEYEKGFSFRDIKQDIKTLKKLLK